MKQIPEVRNQRVTTHRFLTASDFAQIRKMSADSVRRDVRIGRLRPAALTSGGTALFSEEQAAAERRRAAKAGA